MKQQLVIFLTCLLFTLGHCKSKSTKLALRRDPVKNCTAPGYFCEDCSTRVLCLQIGDTFEKTPIETCQSPSKCVINQCTTEVDPVCDHMVDVPFVCSNVGIFPHPFYCNQFVFCLPTKSPYVFDAVVTNCEEGYGYNPLTTECDVDLKGKGCPDDSLPVPICGSLGEVKAHPKNPSLYYICQRYSAKIPGLYPFQHLCPNGKKFTAFKCA